MGQTGTFIANTVTQTRTHKNIYTGPCTCQILRIILQVKYKEMLKPQSSEASWTKIDSTASPSDGFATMETARRAQYERQQLI